MERINALMPTSECIPCDFSKRFYQMDLKNSVSLHLQEMDGKSGVEMKLL